MEFNDVLKNRYACRNFDFSKEVEKEKLDEILETIKLAPSAVNHQSPRVYVIKSELGLERINSVCTCIRNANTVLMFSFNKDEVWTNPFNNEINSGEEDVSILATMLMLKAVELGLQTCWVNFFDANIVKEVFTLPENEQIVVIMPIGYPIEDDEPNPIMHKKRKELSQMVRYL